MATQLISWDVVRHELELSRRSRRFPKKDTCLAIYSRCVNARTPLDECLRVYYPWCADWDKELAALFRGYVERKLATQSLDYDDLLLYWSHLVADGEFAAEIGSWFDHVLVDVVPGYESAAGGNSECDPAGRIRCDGGG